MSVDVRDIKSLAPVGVSKCAEIFVTDIGDRWTYFCAYCEKVTNDIGNFICHIRLDHLNAPQRQLLEQSQPAIETEENVFKTIGSSEQSGENVRRFSSPSLKNARESPLSAADTSNCGEVFVTDIGDRWIYFCTYCEKASNDIGNFICHIRLDHLNAPQQQKLTQNQTAIETEVNGFTIISSIQNDSNLMRSIPTIQIAGVFPTEYPPTTNAEQQLSPRSEIFKEEETIVHNQENVQIICSKVFNMLNEPTMVEPGKTVNKEAPVVSSEYNCSQDEYENDVDGSHRCEESYNEDSKFSNNSYNQISGYNDTFGGEDFMSNILTNKNKMSSKNSKSNASSHLVEKHKSTSNSNKRQLESISGEINITPVIKRMRRFPEKVEVAVKSKLCQNVSKEKGNKTEEEQDDYNTKMKEIDDEIAQYMTLNCEICNLDSENFASLKAHMRKVHNIKQGYTKCCNKMFNKRACLLDHIHQHLDRDYFKCEDCDSTFADRQSMRKHFKTKHQKDEDKIYECSVCSKMFVRKYLLEEHRIFGHRDRSTICKSCNKKYNTLKELYEHKKQHCSSDICDPVSSKRNQLKRQGIIMPKVECDVCGVWLRDKRTLMKHKKKHMESKQPHVCDVCNKVYPSRKAMLRHKGFVHGTYRWHKCDICGKTCKQLSALKEHMTTHTGEVLYKCPHCPKTYNLYSSLHWHRQKVHPIEFEKDRELRKQKVDLNKQPISSISVLSNANGGTQDLLAVGSGQNNDSQNILTITSTNNDLRDGDVTDLSKE